MASCGGSFTFSDQIIQDLSGLFNFDSGFEFGIREEMKAEEGKEELGNKW